MGQQGILPGIPPSLPGHSEHPPSAAALLGAATPAASLKNAFKDRGGGGGGLSFMSRAAFEAIKCAFKLRGLRVPKD